MPKLLKMKQNEIIALREKVKRFEREISKYKIIEDEMMKQLKDSRQSKSIRKEVSSTKRNEGILEKNFGSFKAPPPKEATLKSQINMGQKQHNLSYGSIYMSKEMPMDEEMRLSLLVKEGIDLDNRVRKAGLCTVCNCQLNGNGLTQKSKFKNFENDKENLKDRRNLGNMNREGLLKELKRVEKSKMKWKSSFYTLKEKIMSKTNQLTEDINSTRKHTEQYLAKFFQKYTQMLKEIVVNNSKVTFSLIRRNKEVSWMS
jgi:hypothetical protein